MTNVPQTIWQPNLGEGEYTQSTAVNLIDPADSTIDIIDPSATFVIDTGVTYTELTATTWSASDGS